MTVKIDVKGPIIENGDKWIYDLFGENATCPKDVIDKLPTNGEDVEVNINSYGGYIDEGNEIYTSLMAYPGNVTVNIIMAGSAASIIGMAGRPTMISPVGRVMIHNVACGASGDYHAMDKTSEVLKKANQSLANAYVLKTGLSREEILEKMDKETWLTAQEAKEQGFVDGILFENSERPMLVADGGSGMLSKKVINKVTQLIQSPQTNSGIDTAKVKDYVNEALEKFKNETTVNGKTIQDWINESDKSKESKTNKSPFERFFFDT